MVAVDEPVVDSDDDTVEVPVELAVEVCVVTTHSKKLPSRNPSMAAFKCVAVTEQKSVGTTMNPPSVHEAFPRLPSGNLATTDTILFNIETTLLQSLTLPTRSTVFPARLAQTICADAGRADPELHCAVRLLRVGA